jgi:hypothetical protein
VTTLKVAEEVMYFTQTNIIYKWQYTVPHHPYSTAGITTYAVHRRTCTIIEKKSCSVCVSVAVHPQAVLRIRIHRIHMFFGLPDPDPLVRGMDPDPDPALDTDPDPSIIMQK